MSDSSSRPQPEVGWRTLLRRGWPALLVGILVGLAVGLILDRAHHDQYQASTSVLVTPTGVGATGQVANGRTTGLVNLDTEANLVKSTPVIDRVRTLLKTKDPVQAVAGRISIVVPPNSQLLKISYTAANAADAEKGAAAVATAYLADRAATAEATLTSQTKPVQAEIDSATKKLKSVASDIVNAPAGSSDRTYADSQKQLLTSRITQLNAQLVTLANTVVTPGTIEVKATTPTSPTGAGPTVFVASGIAAGLLLGLFGAYLLARRRIRRLRRSEDVERSIGLPVIARIDQLRMGVLEPVRSPGAESYRRLANVVNASLGSRGGVIVIAGCDDSAVASTVTHNMAATLSRSGEKVAVLRSRAGDPPGPDRAGGGGHATDGEPDGAYRLLAGTGPRTRKLIGQLRKDEDGFILIDVPEPLKTADAQSYAASADAVLLVVGTRTRTTQAMRVLAELDAVSAPILGAVLVRVGGRGLDGGQPLDDYAALAAGPDGMPAVGPGAGAVLLDASVLLDTADLRQHPPAPSDREADGTARPAPPRSPAGRRVAKHADRAQSRLRRD